MSIDKRSADVIASLREKARPWFEKLHAELNKAAAAQGLTVRFVSGTRTWAEQDELYSHGRNGDTRPRVTNARGGFSNHNYGLAVDIGLFKDGKYLPEDPEYAKLGPVGKAVGLEWGGDWKSPVDRPHYQIKIGIGVSDLRDLVLKKGWGAVDALIPVFAKETPPPTTPVVVTYDPVSVYLEDETKKLSLDALFDGARTLVNLVDWCDYFGGTLEMQPTSASITFSGTALHLNYQRIGGKPFAPVSDVNQAYHFDFTFQGTKRPRELILHIPKHP